MNLIKPVQTFTEFETLPGTSIQQAAEQILEFCQKYECSATFDFNAVKMYCHPNSTVDGLMEAYHMIIYTT